MTGESAGETAEPGERSASPRAESLPFSTPPSRAVQVLQALQERLNGAESKRNSVASWLDLGNTGPAACVVYQSWSFTSRHRWHRKAGNPGCFRRKEVLAGVRWDVSKNLGRSDGEPLESPYDLAFELVFQFVEEPLGRAAERLVMDKWGIGWLGTLERETPIVPDWVLARLNPSQ